jgi:FtsH-binding integral membrane protein
MINKQNIIYTGIITMFTVLMTCFTLVIVSRYSLFYQFLNWLEWQGILMIVIGLWILIITNHFYDHKTIDEKLST